MSTRHFVCPIVLILLLVPASANAGARVHEYRMTINPVTFHGGPADPSAKANRDTFLLMGATGSGAPYIGDFESPAKALDPGSPAAHGWTSLDIFQPTRSEWHVSDYFAVNGTYSAYCGDETIPTCGGGDPEGGYGSGWNEMIEFRGTVADKALPTTLSITAVVNIDSEPDYDGTTLQAEKAGAGFVDIAYWDGVSTALAINEVVTYQPGEYLGAGGDEISLVWRFVSDGGWDDWDCSYPSSGAIQLDDVTVTSDNGVSTGGTVDFEDGTLGPLNIRIPQGVGDFAWIWSNLRDLDPCVANTSRQVAFIDNGLVVPGTGGSYCQDWCYGPSGFIVNNTGGLAGPEEHLWNDIISPVMDWPDPSHRGGKLTFTVYRHENLAADSPGVFYNWSVRSSNTGDPADIEDAGWQDRDSGTYAGGPDYHRMVQVVDDLLVENPTHVQIRFGAHEKGWVWGWTGNNGTPAPYYDNVRFETYSMVGPALAAWDHSLANDNFPASGTIDMGDPGSLSVRFDGARDISPPSHNNPAAADSIVFDAVVTRPDAVLVGMPILHYKVSRNPVFDPYRTSSLPAQGQVDCEQSYNVVGLPVPDRYFGDLDDDGVLFPGDRLHYYVTASDRDTIDSSVETSILPADTTGFSDLFHPRAYPAAWTVRCLPTIQDLSGTQPPILFWNDFSEYGGPEQWDTAFLRQTIAWGHEFDEYVTTRASRGLGNGLGGRATLPQLAGYEVLLYSSGTLTRNTISNGDIQSDSGRDAELLTAWLDTGGKGAFLTGDNLAFDLAISGAATSALLGHMGIVVYNADVRDLIGGQSTPRVLEEPGNVVFNTVSSWFADGGCPDLNTFDAVTTAAGSVRLAVFTDPTGVDGGYPYSAATLASGVGVAGTSEIISLPYDFSFVGSDPDEVFKVAARSPARTRMLSDVLARFGVVPGLWEPADANAPSARFAVSHHPNPFNPVVHLDLEVPRPGRLTVKVFDVRGRLVRSLFDERVVARTDLVWDGKDDRGAAAASGVYFYEARMHNETRVGKLTLVR